MPDVVAQIAVNLQRLRKLKGFSQQQVAVTVEMPQGQYSRIENGKVEPTLTTLAKLAEALDSSLAELVRPHSTGLEESVSLPLLEKVRALEGLSKQEREALMTIIDLAIQKQHLKDSISQVLKEG